MRISLDDADVIDEPDINPQNPTGGGGLVIDSLLNYTADFQPPHAVSTGSNGPWDWIISNDLGVSFPAPAAGSVMIVKPDGNISTLQIMVDSNATSGSHRVGIYYLLSMTGAYIMYLSLTIPGVNTNIILTQTELLVAV